MRQTYIKAKMKMKQYPGNKNTVNENTVLSYIET